MNIAINLEGDCFVITTWGPLDHVGPELDVPWCVILPFLLLLVKSIQKPLGVDQELGAFCLMVNLEKETYTQGVVIGRNSMSYRFPTYEHS